MINDKYLQTDIKTVEKINNIPNFFDRLKLAWEYTKYLNINSEQIFYLYLQTKCLSQVFNEITYNDIKAFQRFESDNNYYNKVQNKFKENTNKPKIILLKKDN